MLLGRDREQQALTRLLAAAREGGSGVLAMVGEAGIGKSALLDYAAEQAAGMNVLRARGVQSEAHIPFGGLFELLRPALPRIDQIPAPQAAALESALALRPASAPGRFAVGAATLSLLAAYSEQAPVAVLLDDAHWLDGSSADALLFAFRRLVADPVAVVLALRQGEPSLLDGADLPVLRLLGLDPGSAAELLRRQGDEPLSKELADRLHREAGGNPLVLLELGRERERLADLPPGAPLAAGTSVARVYLSRQQVLPQRTRDVLVLAAALDGGEVSVLARAAPMVGLELPDLVPAEAAGLITVRDSRVEFRHPLARSAVYGAAPADQRRALHRALARALPDTEADRRAWHLALAAFGPDDAASSALEQAGQRAYQRSAYEVSSRAFERAALLAPGGMTPPSPPENTRSWRRGGRPPRAGCGTPRPTPPGSAGSPNVPSRSSPRPAGTHPRPSWPSRSSISGVTSPLAADRSPKRRRSSWPAPSARQRSIRSVPS